MKVVAVGFLALVLAVLHDAVKAEVAAGLRALPYGIVHAAARGLPRASRTRWRNEWIADLDALRADHYDRPLLLLATALRIVLGIPRLRWHQRAGGDVSTATASEPSLYDAILATLLIRARHNGGYLTSDEIGRALVDRGVAPEDMDAILQVLNDMAIEIIEPADTGTVRQHRM